MGFYGSLDEMRILMVTNPYERVVPHKRIPSWLFWLILGWLILLPSSQIIGNKFGITHLRLARTIGAIAAPFLPVAYIWLHHSYRRTMNGLSKILWQDREEYSDWLKGREETIFTFVRPPSKLFTLAVLVATALTTILSDLGYTSTSHQIFLTLWIFPILFLCSHGTYILFALLAELFRTVRRPAKIPFLMLPHPSIIDLQNFFSNGALVFTILFILLTIAFYDAFQTNIVGIIWLSIISLYPLSLFLWSILQVHVLMKKIKEEQYRNISEEVEDVIATVYNTNEKRTVPRLEVLKEAQNKVKELPVWPINLRGVFTLIVTLLLPLSQLIVTILY